MNYVILTLKSREKIIHYYGYFDFFQKQTKKRKRMCPLSTHPLFVFGKRIISRSLGK